MAVFCRHWKLLMPLNFPRGKLGTGGVKGLAAVLHVFTRDMAQRQLCCGGGTTPLHTFSTPGSGVSYPLPPFRSLKVIEGLHLSRKFFEDEPYVMKRTLQNRRILCH